MKSALRIFCLLVSFLLCSLVSKSQVNAKKRDTILINGVVYEKVYTNIHRIDTIYEHPELKNKDHHIRTFYLVTICGGPITVEYSDLFDEHGLRFTTYRQTYEGEDLKNSPVWYNLYR